MQTTIAPGAWRTTLGLALALVLPLHFAADAHAQAKLVRVGLLSLSLPGPEGPPETVAKALQDLGYVDGKNVVLEYRFANYQPQRLPDLAAELVRQNVDVIVAITNAPAFAAKQATRSTPIVVWASHGAVDTGLVPSLARPGGNVTGVESLAPELDAKRLQLLKELVPGVARAGAVFNANDQGAPIHLKSAQGAGSTLGIDVAPLGMRQREDFNPVLAASTAQALDSLLVFTDDLTVVGLGHVTAHALKHRLPVVCEFGWMVAAGCLLSYGPNTREFTQLVARQVDKVLKGAKPADLPMEQATRFELVVNLKTATALGVTIPQGMLLRADEVIR
jgi:putative tryptophan/tyrosine transport system substrate-binding protein